MPIAASSGARAASTSSIRPSAATKRAKADIFHARRSVALMGNTSSPVRSGVLAAIAAWLAVAPMRASADQFDPAIGGLLERVALGDLAAAAEVEARWAQAPETGTQVLADRVRTALAADQTAVARTLAATLTEFAPTFAEGFILQAEAALRDGADAEALAALNRAVVLEPRDYRAHLALARLQARAGDMAGATRHRDAARALNPVLRDWPLSVPPTRDDEI